MQSQRLHLHLNSVQLDVDSNRTLVARRSTIKVVSQRNVSNFQVDKLWNECQSRLTTSCTMALCECAASSAVLSIACAPHCAASHYYEFLSGSRIRLAQLTQFGFVVRLQPRDSRIKVSAVGSVEAATTVSHWISQLAQRNTPFPWNFVA